MLKERGEYFMQYIEDFLLAKRLEGLAQGTLIQYRMELNHLPSFLNKPTINATTSDLRSYFLKHQGLSKRTLNRKISTLKSFYGWLVEEDEYNMERNPMKKIKTPKEPESLPKNLTKQDYEKIRYYPKSDRNQAIIELLVSSGMRIGELVPLNIEDVDMDNRQIKVMGKGSKERIVHFSTISKFCLINYLKQRKDKNPALFLNKYGDRLGARSIEMQVKRIGEKVGITEKVTPHNFRHTFCSMLFSNGADIGFISLEVGHTSPRTTMKYARLDNQTRAQMHDKYLGL